MSSCLKQPSSHPPPLPKRLPCVQCPVETKNLFGSKEALRVHLLAAHFGHHSWVCELCKNAPVQQRFPTKEALVDHYESVENGHGTKEYKVSGSGSLNMRRVY